MALSQSAASDLLDAFRAGDGVDLIRDKPMCSPWRIAAARQAVRTGQARQHAFCGLALSPRAGNHTDGSVPRHSASRTHGARGCRSAEATYPRKP